MIVLLKKYKLEIGLFFLISVVLTIIFSYKMQNGQFVYMADQFFNVSYLETVNNSLFKRRLESLGVHNSYHSVIRFWDILFYLLFYSFSSNFVLAEITLTFVVLLLTQLVVFTGFLKLNELLQFNYKKLVIIAVTLWYSFNSYSLVLWHGGVYNLGSSITYSIFPLLFFYLNKTLFGKLKLRNVVITSILMFLASFTFWLFAVIVFYVVVYSIITLYSLIYVKVTNKKGILLNFLKNSFILGCLYLPLVLFVLSNLVNEFGSKTGDNNANFWPAFGNQQGGLWYQVLLIFSWGIYTVWTPRTMYSFGEYFSSVFYIAATLMLYVFLGVAFFNRKKLIKVTKRPKVSLADIAFPSRKIFITAVFIMLLVTMFFAKAAQPPFGGFFVFLYETVPFFRVFRSADIRFGFGVVFSLSLLLLYASNYLNQKAFSFGLIFLLFIQNFYFFTGVGIYGQNVSDKYYDRIISFDQRYTDTVNFLNNDSKEFGYVLSIPPIEYGHYVYGSEHHIGQDLLSKRSERPFTYLSSWNGTYANTYKYIGMGLLNNEFEKFSNLPIKYVVFRKDIICNECDFVSKDELAENFSQVFENDLFTVFEVEKYMPIINSEVPVSFDILNPVQFRVRLHNVKKETKLNFLISHNKEWKVFPTPFKEEFCPAESISYKNVSECLTPMKIFNSWDSFLLFKKPSFDATHKELFGYANSWEISSDYIKTNFDSSYYKNNSDGTIDIDLVIYYQKQQQYIKTLAFSFALLTLMLTYIFLSRKHK